MRSGIAVPWSNTALRRPPARLRRTPRSRKPHAQAFYEACGFPNPRLHPNAVRSRTINAKSPALNRIPESVVAGNFQCYILLVIESKTLWPSKLNVTGSPRVWTASPDTPLLWVLRDILNLRGTKYGCGIGQCAACTVAPERQTRSRMPDPGFGRGQPTGHDDRRPFSRWTHPVQVAWQEIDVRSAVTAKPAR